MGTGSFPGEELPPKTIYHPVLPIKNDKLIFTLCTKRFEEKIITVHTVMKKEH
jgi:hypothetical protein